MIPLLLQYYLKPFEFANWHPRQPRQHRWCHLDSRRDENSPILYQSLDCSTYAPNHDVDLQLLEVAEINWLFLFDSYHILELVDGAVPVCAEVRLLRLCFLYSLQVYHSKINMSLLAYYIHLTCKLAINLTKFFSVSCKNFVFSASCSCNLFNSECLFENDEI